MYKFYRIIYSVALINSDTQQDGNAHTTMHRQYDCNAHKTMHRQHDCNAHRCTGI